MPVVRDLTQAGALMSFQLGASVLCRAKSSNLEKNSQMLHVVRQVIAIWLLSISKLLT